MKAAAASAIWQRRHLQSAWRRSAKQQRRQGGGAINKRSRAWRSNSVKKNSVKMAANENRRSGGETTNINKGAKQPGDIESDCVRTCTACRCVNFASTARTYACDATPRTATRAFAAAATSASKEIA